MEHPWNKMKVYESTYAIDLLNTFSMIVKLIFKKDLFGNFQQGNDHSSPDDLQKVFPDSNENILI